MRPRCGVLKNSHLSDQDRDFMGIFQILKNPFTTWCRQNKPLFYAGQTTISFWKSVGAIHNGPNDRNVILKIWDYIAFTNFTEWLFTNIFITFIIIMEILSLSHKTSQFWYDCFMQSFMIMCLEVQELFKENDSAKLVNTL